MVKEWLDSRSADGKQWRKRTSSLRRIDGSSFEISRDPPNRDSESSEEGKHSTDVRIAHEPEHSLPPNLTLRNSDSLVNIEIGSSSVSSEFAREDQTENSEGVVRSRENPGLEASTRRVKRS